MRRSASRPRRTASAAASAASGVGAGSARHRCAGALASAFSLRWVLGGGRVRVSLRARTEGRTAATRSSQRSEAPALERWPSIPRLASPHQTPTHPWPAHARAAAVPHLAYCLRKRYRPLACSCRYRAATSGARSGPNVSRSTWAQQAGRWAGVGREAGGVAWRGTAPRRVLERYAGRPPTSSVIQGSLRRPIESSTAQRSPAQRSAAQRSPAAAQQQPSSSPPRR